MNSIPRQLTPGAIGALLLVCASTAGAADNQAGVPLRPADGAGAWTLESQGRSICVIGLSARKSVAGYGLGVGRGCGDALPQEASGWTPTADGMAITGRDGARLIAFGRWSNSLLVSHRDSGADLQLKRGPPETAAGPD